VKTINVDTSHLKWTVSNLLVPPESNGFDPLNMYSARASAGAAAKTGFYLYQGIAFGEGS
jgi:hypothetical protein